MAALDEEADLGSLLLRRTWTVHRLSPLYNLRSSNLARYARELTRVVRSATEWQLDAAELKHRSQSGHRSVALVGARRLGEGVYLQLQMEWFSQPRQVLDKENKENGERSKQEDLKRQSCTVLLCCPTEEIANWHETDLISGDDDTDLSKDDEEEEDDDENAEDGKKRREAFSKFPFLLCKGKTSMVTKVFRWLENKFDTTISEKPTPFPPRHLAEIAGQCTREALSGAFEKMHMLEDLVESQKAEEDREDREQDDLLGLRESLELHQRKQETAKSKAPQPLELTYGLPPTVAGISKINIAIPGASLKDLFHSLSSLTASEGLDQQPNGSEQIHPSQETSSSSSSLPGSLHEKQRTLERQSDVSSTAGASVFSPMMAQEDPLLTAVNRFVAQQLSIRLNGASLLQIATPLVMISCEGRVKFLSRLAIQMILQHLAAMCEVETEK